MGTIHGIAFAGHQFGRSINIGCRITDSSQKLYNRRIAHLDNVCLSFSALPASGSGYRCARDGPGGWGASWVAPQAPPLFANINNGELEGVYIS